jgi:DNA-binding transcriptional MerR regulator
MKKLPVPGISEAARELGLSAQWVRQRRRRARFPKARQDRHGYRYHTLEDVERLYNRRTIGRDG